VHGNNRENNATKIPLRVLDAAVPRSLQNQNLPAAFTLVHGAFLFLAINYVQLTYPQRH
jgi:hypothetical protein